MYTSKCGVAKNRDNCLATWRSICWRFGLASENFRHDSHLCPDDSALRLKHSILASVPDSYSS